MSAKNLALIRRRLLRWYDGNKRDLPWRKAKDPYAIWIAETMLQQTQVKTVLPYYEKFLRAFPNIEALARAPQQRVLRVWSGLGYYRRADNVRQAARVVVRRYEGKMPSDYNALRSLPGIGDYTAGAVLSIAFQRSYPAVDGNARRVLGRLFNVSAEGELRACAERLVPLSRPGEFNQALMELGATLCTPAAPNCAACPVNLDCAARAGNNAHGRPPTRRPSVFANITWPLAVVRHHGKVLLRRRAAKGLLAHLWELPGEAVTQREKAQAALRRQLYDLLVKLSPPRRIGEVRHSITYRRIRAPIYLFDYRSDPEIRLPAPQWRWVRPDKLNGYPMSSMTRKALRVLEIHEKNFS
jgi:A/G-specific adenine glycosylase